MTGACLILWERTGSSSSSLPQRGQEWKVARGALHMCTLLCGWFKRPWNVATRIGTIENFTHTQKKNECLKVSFNQLANTARQWIPLPLGDNFHRKSGNYIGHLCTFLASQMYIFSFTNVFNFPLWFWGTYFHIILLVSLSLLLILGVKLLFFLLI